jgi:hypothetical protein
MNFNFSSMNKKKSLLTPFQICNLQVSIAYRAPVKGPGILRENLSLFDTCIDIRYGFFASTENMDHLLLSWFSSQDQRILLMLKN